MVESERRPPAKSSTFAALSDQNFARYCLAYIPSMSATWIRITAMGYLVYDMTGDSAKLGLISLATSLPQVLLGPVSAGFIDRVNRRNVLVISQILTIVTMFALTWMIAADDITFTRLVVMSVVLGSLLTFDAPVRIAMISSLVDRQLLQNAIAINSSMFNIARVIGPTLAGWFIALVGMTWAFGVTGLLMLPFPIVLMTIPRLRNLAQSREPATGSPIAQLADGYRYIRRTPQIAALVLMSIVPNVFGMNYITMAPAYVKDILHADADMLGYLLAVNGIGAVAGTFSVAHFQDLRHRGVRIAIALVVLGVSLILFGLATSPWLAFGAIFLLGLCWGHTVALTDTVIQLLVDESYRGRVMSVYVMIVALGPASGVLVGWLANWTGIDWALALLGILTLAYLPMLWFRTELRTVD